MAASTRYDFQSDFICDMNENVTEELVRKRAEHNELEIHSLEEISLHQQDIEKIEHLDHWCRNLKILYLQSNLIPKIENVSRMKKLEYLNLALNNIEKIENLEGCESLQKLDLTINFVGELTSVDNLKDVYTLTELFLTGNPCTEFEGYRDYVIATLPQLQRLDGTEITKSERITALQNYPHIRAGILKEQEKWFAKRMKERQEYDERKKNRSELPPLADGEEYNPESDPFWQEKTAFTPESRLETHDHMQEVRKREEKKKEEPQKPRRLFADDGRPFNINEPKIQFKMIDNQEKNSLDLNVEIFKYLDSSLIDCDVQATYVRVTMKGQILQLQLPEEVRPDSSTAQRSQITGHLVISMPKAKGIIIAKTSTADAKKKVSNCDEYKNSRMNNNSKSDSSALLEVGSQPNKNPDWRSIVKEQGDCDVAKKFSSQIPPRRVARVIPERPNSDDFVDDPDVPPLI